MLNKRLILTKKKKAKFLYLEDLYSNPKSLMSSSNKGVNFLNIAFPALRFLNSSIFYAPLYCSLDISISIVVKQIKLFLKGLTQGFFLEFRMIGLGFKVKRTGKFLLRTIKFDIGFSHFIKMPLSNLVKLCRIKRRFLLFSIDYTTLKVLLKQIQNLRKHNPYKLRGLKLTGDKPRNKPGKKQTKR
jgi:hypothetical protein